MKGTGDAAPVSSAVWTLPNAISLARIALIPVFVAAIVHRPTTRGGIVLFAAVMATDWVDGTIARRTHSVSSLGKVLDPVADRLAIAAGIVALVVRGAFPLWAALLILVRDALVLIVGSLALSRRHLRIDVRFIGKVATFSLMIAVPFISWGTLGYALGALTLACGWIAFGAGIVEYYVAAAAYARDLRKGLAR